MSLCVEKLNIIAQIRGNTHNHIVTDISFKVESGEKLAVVGRSGCGKTMTAMAVLGTLPKNCSASGRIMWNEEELLGISGKRRREMLGREIVYIPQSGADFLNPSLKIEAQMKEALKHANVSKRDIRELSKELLISTGIEDAERVLRSYPFQLSGGMSQRVVMAIALGCKPGLVIADEPTKGVDKENSALFLKNIDTLFSNSAVIIITHDISVAAYCDNILVMNKGKKEEYGTSDRIINEPESEYTHMLICDLPHALDHAEQEMM